MHLLGTGMFVHAQFDSNFYSLSPFFLIYSNVLDGYRLRCIIICFFSILIFYTPEKYVFGHYKQKLENAFFSKIDFCQSFFTFLFSDPLYKVKI